MSKWILLDFLTDFLKKITQTRKSSVMLSKKKGRLKHEEYNSCSSWEVPTPFHLNNVRFLGFGVWFLFFCFVLFSFLFCLFGFFVWLVLVCLGFLVVFIFCLAGFFVVVFIKGIFLADRHKAAEFVLLAQSGSHKFSIAIMVTSSFYFFWPHCYSFWRFFTDSQSIFQTVGKKRL